MSDLNLTVQEGDDIYLSITETPAVVTLSQPVISGALSSTVTVANTVTVALDPSSLSALENITVTVGTAVSVGNFPAVQQVSGTVTAGVQNLVFENSSPGFYGVPAMGLDDSDQYRILSLDQDGRLYGSISGTVTVGNSVTIGSCVTHGVNVANSITIGSLPVQLSTTTIGGTARLNVTLSSATTVGATVPSYGNLYGGSDGTNFRAISVDSSGRTVVTGSVSVANLPATQTVAGTVTANISGTVPVSGTFWQSTQPVSLASLPAISGTVTANISAVGQAGQSAVTGVVQLGFREYDGGSSSYLMKQVAPGGGSGLPVRIYGDSTSNPLAIDGSGRASVNINSGNCTVTVGAMPSGALTTRFGSVTTANTAQLTAAVTNSSRKFLLVQNIATSTVTIGIGFAPTTTQGIQLAAGAGLTFDAFCPTGGVWWLSGTTGANWSVLEG